ncbi:MAG: ceramidase [Spirochaetia bacterium]|nr:ceramidase [Spirochaetia bacterium]
MKHTDCVGQISDQLHKSKFIDIYFISAVSLFGLLLSLIYSINGSNFIPDKCIASGLCFCESSGSSVLKQPVNTLSNLSFNIMGPLLAFYYHYRKRIEKRQTAMPSAFHMLYLCLYTLTGTASFVFHATLSKAGGALDIIIMNAFAVFVLMYSLREMIQIKKIVFFICFMMLFSVMSAVKLIYDMYDLEIFAAVLSAGLLMEIVILYRTKFSAGKSFFSGIGLFLVSFIFWFLSRKESDILCMPDSILQPHALWHVLNSLSMAFLYFHYLAVPGKRI